ncbi:MAG TPA: hypothetical protein VI583_15430 [Cyclobacteriaceae bacterium]|nr:hypothetical protein [Cyclobacteriaceae bacterium]
MKKTVESKNNKTFCCKFDMMFRKVFIAFLLLFMARGAYPQWPLIDDGLYLNPSDAGRPYSKINLTGEVFNMVEGQLWQFGFGGAYAFGRHRNQVNLKIPFVRTVFAGIESFSGIGDITAGYSYVFYERSSVTSSFSHATFSLNASFPTGNQYTGQGVGRTVIVPALTLSFKPVEQVGVYPVLRYITSLKPAQGEWAGGFPGAIPDESGSNPEKRISVLQLAGAFNLEFNATWLGLTPVYTYDLNQGESTINLRPEIGKLFNDSILLRLNSTLYIAGKRTLLYWTQFELAYYF